MKHCDQCGVRGASYLPEGALCPNHALPEPYSSCDGKLVETGSCNVCDDEGWIHENWEDKSWRPGRAQRHHPNGTITPVPENEWNKRCSECNGVQNE